MATNVNLADDLVEKARISAAANHRSIPEQIEYYYRVAHIGQENPTLSFSLIQELLIADTEEATSGYFAN